MRLGTLSIFGVAVLGGCLGSIGGDDGASIDRPGDPPAQPVETQELGARRLTRAQIQNTLADALSVQADLGSLLADVATDPAKYGQFSSEAARSDGFVEADLEALFDLSVDRLHALFSDPAKASALVGCSPSSVADPCVAKFVAKLGRRLFRRPLTGDEQQRYASLAGTASTELGGDVARALSLVVVALVEAPSFLYAPEIGADDPERPGRKLYTGAEMATRLAFAIADAGPDDELLAAADAGELDDAAGVEAQARRLVATSAARRGIVDAFFRDYLELTEVPALGKDPAAFPGWNAAIATAMQTEATMMATDAAIDHPSTFASLLTRRDTFVNGPLAKVYGIDGVSGDDFVPYSIPASWARIGVLGTGAFLALHSGTLEPSPTLRGRFVRVKLLCEDIPPPPPGVNTNLPTGGAGADQTKRQRLEAHVTNATCASCHSRMDPLGFALDHFDADGSFRTTEHGLPIDTTGDLDGAPFIDSVSFAELLAGDAAIDRCFARQLFRYAAGRREHLDEIDALDAIGDQHLAIADALVGVVASEPFRSLPTKP